MPPNRKINQGTAKFFKTLGYDQLAKDAKKIKSKEEFHKYMHVARQVSKKSQYAPQVNKYSKLLEDLY